MIIPRTSRAMRSAALLFLSFAVLACGGTKAAEYLAAARLI